MRWPSEELGAHAPPNDSEESSAQLSLDNHPTQTIWGAKKCGLKITSRGDT